MCLSLTLICIAFDCHIKNLIFSYPYGTLELISMVILQNLRENAAKLKSVQRCKLIIRPLRISVLLD